MNLLWPALALVWFYGSPFWTVRQLKQAVLAKDSETASEYIDFPALRENLKAELSASMLDSVDKNQGRFAELGVAMGSAIFDKEIDSMINPAGFRVMLTRHSSNIAVLNDGTQDFEITHFGLSRFRAIDKSNPSGVAFVFHRDWFSWKLSGIELPATSANLSVGVAASSSKPNMPARAIEKAEFPASFQGKWASSVADCANEYSADRLLVSRDTLNFYESEGHLKQIAQSGQDRTVIANLAYEGEGSFWNTKSEMQVSPDWQSLDMWDEGKESEKATYVRCTGNGSVQSDVERYSEDTNATNAM